MKLSRLLRRRAVAPTLASLDAYARWAAAYPPHAHNALMRAEESAMLALMPPIAGAVVVDLASGTGRYGRIAASRGAQTIIALDNSPDMLRANALAWRAQAEAEAIPLASASVDVLLCGLALGHLRAVAPSLREIGRVLQAGGVALISDVHPYLFLNGAQRTFSAPDGGVYAVEHYIHLTEEYILAARDAGLALDEMREPRTEPGGVPVAVAYRFVKRSGLRAGKQDIQADAR